MRSSARPRRRRIYESGLATHGAIRFTIEPLDSARSEVNVEFGWCPRNAPSRLLFPLIEPWVRERYDRALRRRPPRHAPAPRPVHFQRYPIVFMTFKDVKPTS